MLGNLNDPQQKHHDSLHVWNGYLRPFTQFNMRSSGIHQVIMNFLINKHNSIYIHDYLNNPSQL